MNSELQQAIMEQLKAPVKRKGSNDYMTDEEGNVVTAMRAIGLSLTAKAMQGDLNAIAFCITVQQQESDDPKAAQAAADRRQQMTDDNRQAIRATLESDNLWQDSLQIDVEELAHQKTLIDLLSEEQQRPGYRDTYVVPGKNGLMQTVLNPIIDYRDKAVAKFQHGMERLRAEAIKRKLQARQFK